jgi:hypothetical protein
MTAPSYAESVVCKVAAPGGGALRPQTLQAWRSRGLLGVDRSDHEGRTRYTFGGLLRACVLAELSRHSISFLHDYKGSGALLLAEVDRALHEQLARARSTALATPAYVFSDDTLARGEGEGRGGLPPRPLDALHTCFARMADDEHDSAAVLVIDAAKLLRRVLGRMRELGEPVPDEGPRR